MKKPLIRIRDGRSVRLSLFAILLGLLAGAVLILTIGGNPFVSYWHMFRGGLMDLSRIGTALASATNLVLTGLSVAFAFRTGLFNIGAAGQMLAGAMTVTAIGLSIPVGALPRPLVLLIMVLAAGLAGALWGVVPGLLKAKFNVHEVVTCIMMNWIAYNLVSWLIPYHFASSLPSETPLIPKEHLLRAGWMASIFGDNEYINYGFFIALLMMGVVGFILNRTTLGYELKAVGFNRHAAEYAGIRVNRSMILSMAVSGLLAGLAGATFYAGYANKLVVGTLPAQGFDGIAISLIGANTPTGVFLTALFFGILHTGKGFMNAMTDTPPEIADTIIATIVYFAATSILIERYGKVAAKWWNDRKGRKTPAGAAKGGAD